MKACVKPKGNGHGSVYDDGTLCGSQYVVVMTSGGSGPRAAVATWMHEEILETYDEMLHKGLATFQRSNLFTQGVKSGFEPMLVRLMSVLTELEDARASDIFAFGSLFSPGNLSLCVTGELQL